MVVRTSTNPERSKTANIAPPSTYDKAGRLVFETDNDAKLYFNKGSGTVEEVVSLTTLETAWAFYADETSDLLDLAVHSANRRQPTVPQSYTIPHRRRRDPEEISQGTRRAAKVGNGEGSNGAKTS